jgi:hypothetical protein
VKYITYILYNRRTIYVYLVHKGGYLNRSTSCAAKPRETPPKTVVKPILNASVSLNLIMMKEVKKRIKKLLR